MGNIIVGIAEFKVIKYPNKVMTVGLGSCCGVVLYDEVNKIAGLVHILLPNSKSEKNIFNEAKYADTGILLLYNEMKKHGANIRFIKAKLAGGAHMFNFKSGTNSIFTVGEKNVKSCKEVLAKLNISIVSQDVVGTRGRTIVFDTTNNNFLVKTVGKNDKII